jgi:uncharacterized protein (TIGR03546 family)
MNVSGITKLLSALNANRRPEEIAAGIASALLLAFIPAGNLTWFLLFAITFLTKVYLPAEMFFLALFSLVSPLFDPILDAIGGWILSAPALQGMFASWNRTPFVSFTAFNNTLVVGGLLAGVVLWIPLFILSRHLVTLYRTRYRTLLIESPLYKAWQKLPLVTSIRNFAKRGSDIAGRL